MADVGEIFRRFYDNYDREAVIREYSGLCLSIFNTYKTVSFDAEVRMKNDCFAMQINSEYYLPSRFMTVVGFYFENYSCVKNCVWTKSKTNIKRFFMSGIGEFCSYGGKITMNICNDGIQKIVHMMTDASTQTDGVLRSRLCENFRLLEEMNWLEYCRECKIKIAAEKEDARIAEVIKMNLPPDWSNSFLNGKTAAGISVQNAADGLNLSLSNLGKVDIEYISLITGMGVKNVINELRGSIYQNPDKWSECFYIGWETAEEYLSGKVLEKLKEAKRANEKYKGYFANNVAALEAVLPEKIAGEDIYVTPGSPWVPGDVIDDFIKHLLGEYYEETNKKAKFSTVHDADNAVWKIPGKTRYSGQVKSNSTYGTQRIEALQIMERTLNMRPITVTDDEESHTAKSGKRRVINRQETMLAAEKQQMIIGEFQKWVWQDDDRKKRLENIYYETYASGVVREYDGSFLSFPEMSEKENLFGYQKNAVARIMFSSNSLLAHEVGSGKTFVMIAAGMKMRQIGISKKNMYVVPNSIVGQWKSLFERLYPGANVLCIEPSCFTPNKREKAILGIKNGDYDGIVIAYSCFGEIPASDRLHNTVCFADLGINTLFVDEAHNYKNLLIKTKIGNVLGISVNGSAKCTDMYEKIRIVQMQNSGRGVVFATGTPITNSLTDVYVMQKYLQHEEMSIAKLQSFDAWVGMFAEKVTDVEIGVDTSKFRMATRFSKFHNLPELAKLLASVTDFHRVDGENGIPNFSGYTDDTVPKTNELRLYLENISKRADAIHANMADPKVDNMLKLTTDGRKAALDMRLVDSCAVFTCKSKAAHCAGNVMNIYRKMSSKKSTQLIFCDTSTPKPEFNLYDEMKRLLVNMGAAEGEIAFIHDAKNVREREDMFSAVQLGKIRILIGSTSKLGLGVNVQNKLVALHHLDVPWRPADMVQREGRILRQGNENEEVEIYRYITEGSFDAYSWQLLESKQKVISSILSGGADRRSCGEIDDAVLNYAEVKAIAIGNPLLKERVKCANELSRYSTLRRKTAEMRVSLELEMLEMPDRIKYQEELVKKADADRKFLKNNGFAYQAEERRCLREKLYQYLSENELRAEETKAISYRGFDVILPSGMIKNKPFVYIENNGRYRIELGAAKNGILTRIDNYMDGFEKQLELYENNLKNLRKQMWDIAQELSAGDDYSDKIKSITQRIKEIDEELGVVK